MSTKTVADLVAAAKQHIDNLSVEQIGHELSRPDVILIDLRESEERQQNGVIPGALHAPRGMLEFYADAMSPYHRDEFDPSRRVILYCGSGSRSALGAQTLQTLGYDRVAHLDGGIKAWKEAGQPIEGA